MAMDQQIPDDLLHAYVDGQLSPQQQDQVEAYLGTHPEERQEFRDRQLLNKSLHTLFDQALDRPVPANVLNLLKVQDSNVPTRSADTTNLPSSGSKPAATSWIFQSIAAGVLLVVGSLLGWIIRGELSEVTVPARATLESLAVDAHRIYAREKRHAVEVQEPEQKHLMSWLSARLGESVGPANLTEFGYELLGGRLLPADGNPAGMYLYRGPHEAKLTYYITSQPADLKNGNNGSIPNCHKYKDGNTTVCSWTRATLLYFVIADESIDNLRAISQNIHKQLTQPQTNG